jgi:uncharacterized protein DUF4359
MKRTIRLISLAAVGVFLFVTNPTQDDFKDYVQGRVAERLEGQAEGGSLGRMMADLGSGVAGSLAARMSERSDYRLFSIYSVDVGADGDPDELWRFLGIAGQFIELSSPETD